MKTEWTQEPHTTVRWGLFEALRAADKASTVDYWDVVTENLIRQLELRQEWGEQDHVDESLDWFDTREEAEAAILQAAKYRSPHPLVTHLVSEWKRVDSDE